MFTCIACQGELRRKCNIRKNYGITKESGGHLRPGIFLKLRRIPGILTPTDYYAGAKSTEYTSVKIRHL